MKITKVDNNRSAIRDDQQSGYIYRNQDQSKEKKVKEVVDARIDNANQLYSAFTKRRLDSVIQLKYSKIDRNWDKTCQRIFDEQLKTIFSNEKKSFEQKKKELIEYRSGDKEYKISPEDAMVIVNTRLRKGLKKKNYAKTAADILCAVSDCHSYKTLIRKISDQDLKDLFEISQEDYHKTHQRKTIIKSIENQDVKVNVIKGEKGSVLRLAYAEKKPVLYEMVLKCTDNGDRDRIEKSMKEALALFFEECADTIRECEKRNCRSLLECTYGKEAVFSSDAIWSESDTKMSDQEVLEKKRKALMDECFSRKRKAQSTEPDAYTSFWIDFIANKLEDCFKRPFRLKESSNSIIYYIRSMWQEMNFCMAEQYINMGKAVYHFAMPKVQNEIANEYGVVLPPFKNGITSFHYEVIKAEETLDRKMFAAITFAMNQFSNACDPSKNIFDKKADEFLKKCDEIQLASVLRYFGGYSRWKGEVDSPEKFLEAIRGYFESLRNYYYHYTDGNKKELDNKSSIIKMIIKQESLAATDVIKKTYYSNNVFKYYREKDIADCLSVFYAEYPGREAQIPAFNNVIKKKAVREIYREITKRTLDADITEAGERIVFSGTFYFLLKEIYYQAFLTDSNLKDYFVKGLAAAQEASQKNHKKGNNDEKAFKNFNEIISLYKNASVSEICQAVMTEYAMQNNGNRRNDKKKNFDHYPILLYTILRNAFLQYINKNRNLYQFLINPPVKVEVKKVEDYLNEWTCDAYAGLWNQKVNDEDYGWYVVSHFIPSKDLNHLIGSMKSYLQFTRDVRIRAQRGGISEFETGTKEREESLHRVIRVLEYVLKYCSNKFSNNFSDYYYDTDEEKSKEKYAEYLQKIVKYTPGKKQGSWNELVSFCSINSVRYADEMNPIVNRNVELARMYGMEDMIAAIYTRPTTDHYKKLAMRKNKFEKMKDNEGIRTEEEQMEVVKYQQDINWLELHDVVSLTQMTNDLLSQLISLSYIRERDLLYYQLGYYYMKLQNCPYIDGQDLNVLEGEQIHISAGAVLYQIMAMYTYGMKIFYIESDGAAKVVKGSNKMQTSLKLMYLAKEKSDKEKEYNQKKYGYLYYEEGMGFFGEEKVRGRAVSIRNYVDHNNFFFGKDPMSLLELYSEVYDYFFSYNKKLKKSVPVLLKNILEKYMVRIDLDFKNKCDKDGVNKTLLGVSVIKSGVYTYQVKCAGKVERGAKNNKHSVTCEKEMEVHSRDYIKSVRRLLEYKKG